MSLETGTTTLVLGGQASGKSDTALELLDGIRGERLFAATGRARDLAFREQILAHRANRDPQVRVAEVEAELPELLVRERDRFAGVLVDSLDFWLFTCQQQAVVREKTGALLQVLDEWGKPGAGEGRRAALILVSQEAGLGLGASDAASRAFVRDLGALNRAVAQQADRVVFVAAGLSLNLKGAAR
jgi:adenosylcobinamide kinase/adenosylcobinamide-phosphate guanylyltransferase